MNYNKDIEIDETALDVEWLNQPKLALEYGKHWADLTRQLAALKEKQQLLKAQLTDKINKDVGKYLGAGVKATVGNIDSWILQQEEWQGLQEQLRDMEYEVNVASIAKSEMGNSRKSALENLVRLYSSSYFAGPNMPRDLVIEADKYTKKMEEQKKANGKIRMQRKK